MSAPLLPLVYQRRCFSSRLPRDLAPNIADAPGAAHPRSAPAAARSDGRPIPRPSAFAYPDRHVTRLLTVRASSIYRPSRSVCFRLAKRLPADYARRGTTVAAERIVLTASTSEAYSVLFKLLCDPGDTVLVPAPSYPLFDHLSTPRCGDDSAVSSRIPRPVDAGRTSVDDSWTDTNPRRARRESQQSHWFVAVARGERVLAAGARERDAALIIDEVFMDYPLAPAPTSGTQAPHPRRPTAPRPAPPGPLYFPPGRPVEICRAAAGETRVDRRRRP